VGVVAIMLAAVIFVATQPQIRNCPANGARWLRQAGSAGVASLLGLVV
jgi:hypothetical protein